MCVKIILNINDLLRTQLLTKFFILDCREYLLNFEIRRIPIVETIPSKTDEYNSVFLTTWHCIVLNAELPKNALLQTVFLAMFPTCRGGFKVRRTPV